MSNLWRRTLEDYRGRLMRCAPGTHEAAAQLILRHVQRDAAVLDLASGTGAFLARLRDLGFSKLNAVELNVQGFQLENVTPMAINLNSSFAEQLPHDIGLISAIEIIEHLDCPRSFLRNIHALLAERGYLLLTTPNVASWLGRARFLISGELRQFQRRDYDYQRHISPITDVQMRLMLEEAGLRLVDFTTAGTFFGPLKAAVLSPISALARMALGRLATGDVSLYLAQKTSEATSSAGRDSFYFMQTGA